MPGQVYNIYTHIIHMLRLHSVACAFLDPGTPRCYVQALGNTKISLFPVLSNLRTILRTMVKTV